MHTCMKTTYPHITYMHASPYYLTKF